jgi:surface protein
MFHNCSSLTSLNLSNFNTNNVNNMNEMFSYLNKKCDIITTDNNLLNLLTNL